PIACLKFVTGEAAVCRLRSAPIRDRAGLRPPLGSCSHEIDLPAPASRALKASVPLRNGHSGAVTLRHVVGIIGLDLAPAVPAPHNQPDPCHRCVAEGHRRAGYTDRQFQAVISTWLKTGVSKANRWRANPIPGPLYSAFGRSPGGSHRCALTRIVSAASD